MKTKSIQGIVIPTKWDHLGNATDIAIMGRDEMVYKVFKNSLGTELMKFLRQEIIAIGAIKNLNKEKREIRLTDFQLCNPLFEKQPF